MNEKVEAEYMQTNTLLYKITKDGKSSYLYVLNPIEGLSPEAEFAFHKQTDRVVLPFSQSSIENVDIISAITELQHQYGGFDGFVKLLKTEGLYEDLVKELRTQASFATLSTEEIDKILNQYPPLSLEFEIAVDPVTQVFLKKTRSLGKHHLFGFDTTKSALERSLGLPFLNPEEQARLYCVKRKNKKKLTKIALRELDKRVIEAFQKGNAILVATIAQKYIKSLLEEQKPFAWSLGKKSYGKTEASKNWPMLIIEEEIKFYAHALQPHLAQGNAFIVLPVLSLHGVLNHLLNDGYTIEAVHEQKRQFFTLSFWDRLQKLWLFQTTGMTAFGLGYIAAGSVLLVLGITIISSSIIGSYLLTGGMIVFGVILIGFVLSRMKDLIDTYRKEPQLPESLVFQTTRVDHYTQSLTEYFVKHPELLDRDQIQFLLNGIFSPNPINERYQLAQSIFNGTHGFYQDTELGQTLLNTLPSKVTYSPIAIHQSVLQTEGLMEVRADADIEVDTDFVNSNPPHNIDGRDKWGFK